MDNLLDYVSRAGAAGFDELPLTEVDLACFTQLSYLPYAAAFVAMERPSLQEAGDALAGVEADKVYNVFLRKRLELMRAMMEAPRYAGIILSDYIREIDPQSEKQFCALTLTLPGGDRVISFEGTDSTLVGWKEDFNMSFVSPVPSQEAARAYLHRIAAGCGEAPLILTGHSKGGNLAVWSAAFAREDVQRRVLGVHSFDGPGLIDQDADSAEYARISGRIHAYLPQNSLVGVLMRQHVPSIVVKSHAFSVMQHDLFTWEVEPEGHVFTRMPELSRSARLRDEALDVWLRGLSMENRECFCDAIYKVLSADESNETLIDLVRVDRDSAIRALRAIRDIDPMIRKMIRRAIFELFTGSVEVIVEAAKEAVLEALPIGREDKDTKDAE